MMSWWTYCTNTVVDGVGRATRILRYHFPWAFRMNLRRLLALLTMVTLFHLSVATGNAACAPHSATPTASLHESSAQGHSGHRMGGAVVGNPGDAASDYSTPEPCDTASLAQCCEAMVQCVMFGLLTSESMVAVVAPEPAARISAALVDAPASFAPAPESPPPKA